MKSLIVAILMGGLLIIPSAHAQNAPIDGSTVRALTRDLYDPKRLNEAEIATLDAAIQIAIRDEAVQESLRTYRDARKAYQENQGKYPNDRDRNVSVVYRETGNKAREALSKAMIASNAEVAPLFEKADPNKVGKNEGEDDTDSASGNKAAVAPISDVPGLPRVLLIGDSISIGYTIPVRQLLKDKANVHRIPINGGATEVGLDKMNEWLGDGRWDVIHFNFGLHDAKYASADTLRATRDQYLKNLQELIAQMKASGAKLIFATTTPTPAKLSRATRRFDSIPERNDLAVQLMKENDVAIDDLYNVVLPVQEKIQRPGDVHFTPEGYDLLARAVAASVEENLPKK